MVKNERILFHLTKYINLLKVLWTGVKINCVIKKMLKNIFNVEFECAKIFNLKRSKHAILKISFDPLSLLHWLMWMSQFKVGWCKAINDWDSLSNNYWNTPCRTINQISFLKWSRSFQVIISFKLFLVPLIQVSLNRPIKANWIEPEPTSYIHRKSSDVRVWNPSPLLCYLF